MPTSPDEQKVRFDFWLLFGALYVVGLFSAQFVIRRFHIPVESSVAGVPTLAASFIVTNLIFRKRGISVVNQSVRILEKKAMPEAEVPFQCELYMERKSWRWLTVIFVSFLFLLLFLAFRHPPKPGEWSSVAGLLGLFATIALAFAFLGWVRTPLIARADEDGVTTITGWKKRNFAPWSQIQSCQQIQTDFLAMKSSGMVWHFKDENGKLLLNVVPFNVPEEHQKQFAQGLNHYMIRSDFDAS